MSTQDGGTAVVGAGEHRYRLVDDWVKMPPGWAPLGQAFPATDSAGNVFVLNRSEHPLVIFDPDGNVIDEWRQEWLTSAHGICIDASDNVWLGIFQSHIVQKCDHDGAVLMTLGTPGQSSNPDAVDHLGYFPEPPPRAFGPFSYATDIAVAPNGDVYVTDGYANTRVHRFAPDGTLLRSWGEPGRETGTLHLPHAIDVYEDRLFVASRESCRVNVYSTEGEFLDEWTDVGLPAGVCIDEQGAVYVAEGAGWSKRAVLCADRFVSVFSQDGEVLARWSPPFGGPGHAIARHSDGALYVGQNVPDNRLLKYERV
jgi:sugar lactone lactonase YvrE